MRKRIQPRNFANKTIVRVQKPPRNHTLEAIRAVQVALQHKRQTADSCRREEDLLTLIAVLYAPENSLVIYGQPTPRHSFVKVTPPKKGRRQKIWDSIEIGKNKNKKTSECSEIKRCNLFPQVLFSIVFPSLRR